MPFYPHYPHTCILPPSLLHCYTHTHAHMAWHCLPALPCPLPTPHPPPPLHCTHTPHLYHLHTLPALLATPPPPPHTTFSPCTRLCLTLFPCYLLQTFGLYILPLRLFSPPLGNGWRTVPPASRRANYLAKHAFIYAPYLPPSTPHFTPLRAYPAAARRPYTPPGACYTNLPPAPHLPTLPPHMPAPYPTHPNTAFRRPAPTFQPVPVCTYTHLGFHLLGHSLVHMPRVYYLQFGSQPATTTRSAATPHMPACPHLPAHGGSRVHTAYQVPQHSPVWFVVAPPPPSFPHTPHPTFHTPPPPAHTPRPHHPIPTPHPHPHACPYRSATVVLFPCLPG